MRCGSPQGSVPPRLRAALGLASAPALALAFARLLALLHGRHAQSPEQAAALAGAHQLVARLDTLQAREHRLPGAADGLAALSAGEGTATPLDPWGRPFRYELSSDRRWADVVSLGADGKTGGRGDDADVSGRFGVLHDPPSPLVDGLANVLFLVLLAVLWRRCTHSPFARGLLAGTGAVGAALLFFLVAPGFSAARLATSAVALLSLTSSIALLRGHPAARTLTVAATLAVYAIFGWIAEE